MSVPSSNVTTTCDRPNFEIDRNCSKPGSPLIACSMGKVICRSTSSGAKCRGDRVDLHLHRRGVGKGIDVESPERNRPGHADAQHARK